MNPELILFACLLAPFAGALLLLFSGEGALPPRIALAASLLPLAGGLWLLASPLAPESGFYLLRSYPWISAPGFDIRFIVGVDGISLWLLLLTALLFPLLVLLSQGRIAQQQRMYYFLLLTLETGVLGFFLSLDLLQMYLFFEMVLIPAILLIARWGHEQRQAAALKFFIYTLAGSLLMLVSILYLASYAGGGTVSSSLFAVREAIAAGSIAPEALRWVFLGFVLSFAIKTPLFPLHSWQPSAYREAPLAAAVVMGALLSKMGTYGFIRFGISLFPQTSMELAPYLSALAVVSILYGAWLASIQQNVRTLIAYSSLSHLGFIVLGIFSFSLEALDGAVIQMTAHGVSTAAMFILAEYMHQRRGSYELSAYRGLAPGAPLFAFYFVITAMASVGLPGLSGFVGEFMILIGSFNSPVIASALAVLATLGVVLAAVYLLNFTRKALFGEASGEAFAELSRKEHLLLLPLVLLMFWIGLYAAPFQGVIDRASATQLSGVSQPAPLVAPVAQMPAAAPDSLAPAHP